MIAWGKIALKESIDPRKLTQLVNLSNKWCFSPQLIVMLCTFDTLFNAISILEYSLKKGFGLISYSTPVYVNLWPKVIYPLQVNAFFCIFVSNLFPQK